MRTRSLLARLLDDPALTLSVSVAYSAAIAWIDYSTDYELRFGVLYVPGVILASWGAGRAAGIGIAVAVAAVWMATMFLKYPYASAAVHVWEGGFHLLMYAAFAVITARLKHALRLAEALAREREEQLGRTARLIAVGEMASTFAHELNQPLGAIANYNNAAIRLLKSRSAAPDAPPQAGSADDRALLEIMEKASGQALRAGEVVQRIREFVRRQAPELRAERPEEMVAEAVAAAEGELLGGAPEISVEVPPGLPNVAADRSMIAKVMVNLARNAVDAMADLPGREQRLVLRAAAREGRVEFQFADRGRGVPPDLEQKLFQPFLSSKAGGLGLGLAICRSIVEYHRGELWFTRNPEGGTTFHFTLPVAA
jgi:signal transduction histidine kinase